MDDEMKLMDAFIKRLFRRKYYLGFITVMMGITAANAIALVHISSGTQLPFLLFLMALSVAVPTGLLFLCSQVLRRLLATQKELKECKLSFDALLYNLPIPAYLKDQKGRYTYVNRAWEELYVNAPIEFIGKSDRELWTADVAERICRNDREVLDGAKPLTFTETITSGEDECHLQVIRLPLFSNGRPHLLCGIAMDITLQLHNEQELTRLEAQLQQTQKMEAIGTLAGGIAHDFNNILSAIMGYAELAQLDLTEGGTAKERLDHIIKATQRARDLVSQILSFSRKRDVRKKPFQVNSVVEEALKLLRATLPAAIEIRPNLSATTDPIFTDPTLIHQVVMNLCANAAHAMEKKGGILDVALAPFKVNGAKNDRLGDISPGRYLRLVVTDNGEGMTPEVCERIFDPFFTTKEDGRGTGMGLAMVQGIVKDHNGTILVDSTPGRGTRFEVLFPTIQEESRVSGRDSTGPIGGSETILFVDDEVSLADLGKQALERLGYRVEALTNPDDALALISDAKDRFDLVITDLSMPQMNGDLLVRRIHNLQPDIPAILCTGYSERITHENVHAMGIRALLSKPLSLMELSQTIRSILDQPGDGFRRAS
jgi:PAS domain S-box-containing protein